MRFSIIVPVYNVENYLRKCLDSLIAQNCHDYELILIDDGSQDNSGKICDEYAGNHENIKVIHKSNEGLAATWMREGLDEARGEYVGSIDSDDWVDTNLLEKISNVIDSNKPDIIVYGYKNVNDLGEINNTISARNGYYDKKAIEQEIFPKLINTGRFENRNCLYLSRVNKFMKRELLLHNRQHYCYHISFGEDNFWTIPNVLSANSMYVFSDWYPYSYRINPSSISHTYHEGLWMKFNELAQREMSILKSFDMEWMCNQVYNDMVYHAVICINNIFRGKMDRKKTINEIKKIVNSPDLQKGFSGIQSWECSFVQRKYLQLMKLKAVNIIYIVKKTQCFLRNRR